MQTIETFVPERKRSRFGPEFNHMSLNTESECQAAIDELDKEMADISAQIDALKLRRESYLAIASVDDDAAAWLADFNDWIHRACKAFNHRRRLKFSLVGRCKVLRAKEGNGSIAAEIRKANAEMNARAAEAKAERIRADEQRRRNLIEIILELTKPKFTRQEWVEMWAEAKRIKAERDAENGD